MQSNLPRTLLAGLAGGMALNLSLLVTFRLLGFGWRGGGVLLDPARQSPKLIAVWTQIEPLPLVVARPLVILVGLLFLGLVHAFVYRWLSPAWPPGIGPRALRMGALLFLLTYVFWEFFTPFNLFGEPLALIALELVFWAIVAASEAIALAVVFEWGHNAHAGALGGR